MDRHERSRARRSNGPSQDRSGCRPLRSTCEPRRGVRRRSSRTGTRRGQRHHRTRRAHAGRRPTRRFGGARSWGPRDPGARSRHDGTIVSAAPRRLSLLPGQLRRRRTARRCWSRPAAIPNSAPRMPSGGTPRPVRAYMLAIPATVWATPTDLFVAPSIRRRSSRGRPSVGWPPGKSLDGSRQAGGGRDSEDRTGSVLGHRDLPCVYSVSQGRMFWLRWNRLSGSYARLTSTRRS